MPSVFRMRTSAAPLIERSLQGLSLATRVSGSDVLLRRAGSGIFRHGRAGSHRVSVLPHGDAVYFVKYCFPRFCPFVFTFFAANQRAIGRLNPDVSVFIARPMSSSF